MSAKELAAWKRVARALAVQLSSHAFCEYHPEAQPGKDCPFCADRAAYLAYVALDGGRDYRFGPPGTPISVFDLAKRYEDE